MRRRPHVSPQGSPPPPAGTLSPVATQAHRPARRGRGVDHRAALGGAVARGLRAGDRRHRGRRARARLVALARPRPARPDAARTGPGSTSAASCARAPRYRSSWSPPAARRPTAWSGSRSARTTTSSSPSAHVRWSPASGPCSAAPPLPRRPARRRRSSSAASASTAARRTATLGGRAARAVAQGVRPPAPARRERGHGRQARAADRRGLGHELVRLDQDARRPRQRVAEEARRRPERASLHPHGARRRLPLRRRGRAVN